jgi:sarcosine oxidase/L-pipecolate oxidase
VLVAPCSTTCRRVCRSGASVALLEQFDFLHRRGSSHGDSRITRRVYLQDHYVALMVRIIAFASVVCRAPPL